MEEEVEDEKEEKKRDLFSIKEEINPGGVFDIGVYYSTFTRKLNYL